MSEQTSLLDLIERAKRPNDLHVIDEVLYGLCRNYPSHTNNGEVIAKVWLIGRSYAAAIERGRSTTKANDNFYVDIVGPRIRASSIDSWLDDCRGQSLSEDTLLVSIDIHSKTTELFREISGSDKRSLASKYLHFHLPDFFFIYDSRANKAVTRLSKYFSFSVRASKYANLGDNDYRVFARKCLLLRENISLKYNLTLSPRELDNVFLSVVETDDLTF